MTTSLSRGVASLHIVFLAVYLRKRKNILENEHNVEVNKTASIAIIAIFPASTLRSGFQSRHRKLG
jgi:hypothetical protein